MEYNFFTECFVSEKNKIENLSYACIKPIVNRTCSNSIFFKMGPYAKKLYFTYSTCFCMWYQLLVGCPCYAGHPVEPWYVFVSSHILLGIT